MPTSLQKKAYMILQDAIGVYAAKKYKKFYATKDDKTIYISLKEVLTEAMGEKKAVRTLKSMDIEI